MKICFWLVSGLLAVGAVVHAQSPARRAPRVDTTDPASPGGHACFYRRRVPVERLDAGDSMDGLLELRARLQGSDSAARRAFRSRQRVSPLGFKAADIKRANAILIGHGHFDHMSDAASVAIRTGALVVGAPVTIDKLRTQSVDPGSS